MVSLYKKIRVCWEMKVGCKPKEPVVASPHFTGPLEVCNAKRLRAFTAV